jgi:hypothetical protein
MHWPVPFCSFYASTIFQVSPEGVAIRDEKVFRFAKDQNIPLLMLTSGGDLAHHYLSSSALSCIL